MSRLSEKVIQPIDTTPKSLTASVFSCTREIKPPAIELPEQLKLNTRLRMDGERFLSLLPADSIPVAFFDPQYRGVLDKLGYGNEGEKRGKARCELKQMTNETICKFIRGINSALIPSGHLFLWMDKFHLCTDFTDWLNGTELSVVDMLTWNKGRIGMGYRTRRKSEYLVILQKEPRRAKGVWKLHNIPDVWPEEVKRNGHAHRKPLDLQSKLIEAVSNPDDLVVDPAAGSFVILEACKTSGRNFIGCDLEG